MSNSNVGLTSCSIEVCSLTSAKSKKAVSIGVLFPCRQVAAKAVVKVCKSALQRALECVFGTDSRLKRVAHTPKGLCKKFLLSFTMV